MKSDSKIYSGIYKDLVELLGEDITLEIYDNFKGQQVTFPMRLYSKSYVEEYLIKNYEGKNLKELSKELGYTCNWLQQLINKLNKNEFRKYKVKNI